MKKKSKVDFGAYAFLIPAAVIYLSVIVITGILLTVYQSV